MFDLEKEIKQWLARFRKHRAFDHGSIREMELHLKDHIDDLMANGHNEEDAFKLAVAEFGDIGSMAIEEFQIQKRKPTLRSVVHTAMLRNFYLSSLRHFFRHRNYFLTNILGLTVGIACFIMISVYVLSEVTYDKFHSDAENIYRINTKFTNPSTSGDRATSHSPLTRTLLNMYPEVESATRVLRLGSLRLGTIESGREHYSEENILYVDSTFFDVFDFRLLKGDPKKVLVDRASMVLTERSAKRYFGDEDPIGKQMTIEEDNRFFYVVTGVVADVPANSHLQFDMLVSMSTGEEWNSDQWIASSSVHSYIKLKRGANATALEAKMPDIVHKFLGPEIERYSGLTMEQWEKAGGYTGYYLIPLENIHLHSTSTDELEPGGNITYIYVYALIAIIILFIAIFNFVNMATAQSVLRAKEVGVRKVIGSTRIGLIFQFIVESLIVSLIATVIAGVLVILLEPSFIALIDKDLALDIVFNYKGILLLLSLAVIVGIMGGAYPAFVMAGFQPADVLKGVFNKKARAGWLRNFLVVMQFTASIVIIIGTIVVYTQLDYMLAKDLGFNKDNILVIQRPDKLKEGQETFKNSLLAIPGVTGIAQSNTIPGKLYPERSYRPNGNNESFVFKFNHVSHTFLEVMNIGMVSGRFFSTGHSLDSKAVVINEAAAKAFDFKDPVGQELSSPWHRGETLTIIGVVKDFNTQSLHSVVQPIAFELMPENSDIGSYIMVKMKSDDIRKTVQLVADTWARQSNGKLFESFFLDEDYEKLYKSEIITGKVLIVFTTLSIFIACLGLVALLAFTASARRKEIGIRKILGAGIGRLVNLLSADVVKLIAISTLVAWPLAYFGSRYWLQNFVDRVKINPGVYLIATIIVAIICGLAIGIQILKAATENPVHSLREE